MHTFCSSLTKFSFTKSVQTSFAPQNPSIDAFLVTKVIINYNNFIAIDPIKKIGVSLMSTDKNLAGNKKNAWLKGKDY